MELWRPDLRSPAALLVPSVVARFCVGRRDPALSAEGLPLLPLCPDHRFRAVQIVIFVLSAGAGPLRERGCQGPATATYADGTREQITGRPISDPNFVSITDEQGYETGLYETGQQALHDSEQSALITGGILASVATGGLADGAIAGVGGALVLRGLFAAGTGDLTFQGTQSGAHQLDPSLGEPDFSVPEFGLALALGAIAPLVAGGITKLFGPSVAPEIVPATAEPLTFPETFEPPPPQPASIPEPPPAPVSVPPRHASGRRWRYGRSLGDGRPDIDPAGSPRCRALRATESSYRHGSGRRPRARCRDRAGKLERGCGRAGRRDGDTAASAAGRDGDAAPRADGARGRGLGKYRTGRERHFLTGTAGHQGAVERICACGVGTTASTLCTKQCNW